jgi:hypothetical protein
MEGNNLLPEDKQSKSEVWDEIEENNYEIANKFIQHYSSNIEINFVNTIPTVDKNEH